MIAKDFITVLYGNGKWQDDDGEIYDIDNIKLPMLLDGKHLCIYSKECEDVLENRSYDDGMILSFQVEKIEYW